MSFSPAIDALSPEHTTLNIQNNDNNHAPMRLLSNPLYSTFIGGEANEYSTDIATDNLGNIYITGYTYSSNFPVKGYNETSQEGDADCFVMKFNSAGNDLIYSAIIGGSGYDVAYSIDVDSEGNAYVVGRTASYDFPTLNAFDDSYNGGSDLFLFKINSAGDALLYSTYIGGSNYDSAESVCLDQSGDVYIVGETDSLDFPITAGALDESYNADGDGFVLKFNTQCDALMFSTFFGGFEDDYLVSVTVDSVGAVYVAGYTSSEDIPITSDAYDRSYNGGYSDSIIFKLNSEGNSLLFSTYYGGAQRDYPSSILVDSYGNSYVVGTTYSSDFPSENAFNGEPDCSVLKLNRYGNSSIFSTVVGGSDYDFGNDLAATSDGCVVVVGRTYSNDFPITSAAIASSKNRQSDMFAFKLNNTGNELLYSTYFGGSLDDQAEAITLDSYGNAIITGGTYSSDFPTKDAYSSASNGNRECFLLKIPDLTDSDGDLLTDIDEISIGTNLNSGDTDFDSFSDYWEYQNGFDPTDSAVPLSEYLIFYATMIELVTLVAVAIPAIAFRHQISGAFYRILPFSHHSLLYECPSCKTRFEAPSAGAGSRRRKCPECGVKATKENLVPKEDLVAE